MTTTRAPANRPAIDDGRARRLARVLGALSLGLGVGALAAPRSVYRLAGVADSARARAVTQLVGVRELGLAVGLLVTGRPGWVWARVAGDAVDLTALGGTLRNRGTDRRRAAMAVAGVAGVAAADLVSALRGSRAARPARRALRVREGVTVNRPSHEVYRFWRDLANLPRAAYHLESVHPVGDDRSRWVARGPAGIRVRWDAEIVEDLPSRLVAWRSLPGTLVPNAGRVRFVPAGGGRGTEVRVEMEYVPPGGAVGRAIALLFGEEPGQQVLDDLRRVKQVLEAGEVVASDGSPRGTGLRQQVMQRPARPMPTAPAR